MHGPDVRRLQSLLSAHKALQKPLLADGHFGNLTNAAVIAFQQRAGLTVDAWSGPRHGRYCKRTRSQP
jgi:peptidoglycan hydrolase-like protein with peptidoglycan-binding domain